MERNKINKDGLKLILGNFLAAPLLGLLTFSAAGHTALPTVWIFLIITFIHLQFSSIFLYFTDPDLMNRRGGWKNQKNIDPKDKIYLFGYGIFSFYVFAIVAGLDLGRFHWSAQLPTPFFFFGILILILSLILIHWSYATNTYFETTIRIQKDRKQKVITSGPYMIMRHPGYFGAILWNFANFFIIGSIYSLIPILIGSIFLVLRSKYEDNFLQDKLNGYKEYSKKTKYRLIPGIW